MSHIRGSLKLQYYSFSVMLSFFAKGSYQKHSQTTFPFLPVPCTQFFSFTLELIYYFDLLVTNRINLFHSFIALHSFKKKIILQRTLCLFNTSYQWLIFFIINKIGSLETHERFNSWASLRSQIMLLLLLYSLWQHFINF